MSRLLTKGETAEALAVSVRTVERLIASGKLPAVYIGPTRRSVRLRPLDVEHYVLAHREALTPVEVAI